MNFSPKAATEREFLAQLVKVAERAGGIIKRYIKRTPTGYDFYDLEAMLLALKNYGYKLEPWAQKIADKAVERIERENRALWRRAGLSDVAIKVGNDVARETARRLVGEQVELITSIPTGMAERVQRWAHEAQTGGRRASEVAEAIENSAIVGVNRAKLIARTEIAKANATLTRARAESVGITHYIWRTAGDQAVREAHEQMDGLVFEFATAPFVEGEGYHHPGEFPNCRCYAEPIIPRKDDSANKNDLQVGVSF